MSKFRIFHVNTLQPPHLVGGAERTVSTVTHSLAARGHSMHVFSIAPKEQGIRHEVSDNFTGTFVGLQNFYWPFDDTRRPFYQRLAWHARDAWNPAMGKIVGSYIDAEKPDVVVTHNLQGWSCNVWKQSAKRKIPVIHVIHDQSLICPQTAMFRNGKPCESQCFSCDALSITRRATQNNVSAVVAVSQAILQRNEQYGMFAETKQKKVIYNTWRGAWPAQRTPLPIEANPHAGLTVGFMGRIEGEKGIDVLCDAWRQLQRYGIKLLIAGTGRPEYVEYLQQHYGVPASSFLGMQKPESFFPKVDLVVVPSRAFEGLGNVAFEAMVFGRPVIVSDQGGLPEIPDASCGLVTPADDVPALVKALQSFADSIPNLIAKSEGAHLRGKAFHPDHQADAYESLITDVLEKSK